MGRIEVLRTWRKWARYLGLEQWKSERAATKARQGEVWYKQGVGDEKKFLRTFSQRLKNCFGQSWHDKLQSSDRFFEYKLMKQNFGMEEYICSMKGHLRDALLKFRAGVSWIKAHRFRFKPGADTSCPFCPHETEDELHVLCKCTTYNNIRHGFLRRDGLWSSVPYHSVMETTNQCRLQQIALFLIKAGKMRQITDLSWNSSGT